MVEPANPAGIRPGPRNRSFWYLVVAPLAAGGTCAPSPVLGADQEVQLWLTGTMATQVTDEITGSFELSRRIREDEDQIVLRGGADLEFSETVSVGAGIAYLNAIDDVLEVGDDQEVRLHQQFVIRAGSLSFRTRMEERFFEDADSMQLRIRQRIQASGPLAERVEASVAAEAFFVASSASHGEDHGIAQWRFSAAATYRVGPALEASVGYLVMYTPVTGAADRIAHVPQLTLIYRH